MPRPKPVDATLHGLTDYMVGATLSTVFPKLAGIEGTRAAKQIRLAGALHAGYSIFTDYPLGAVKAIPYKAHLALDLAGAVALATAPWLTGQHRKGRDQWVFNVGLAVFELAALAMTDPSGRGDDHSDVEAVREANELDPHARIYEGGPAVRAAAAGAAV